MCNNVSALHIWTISPISYVWGVSVNSSFHVLPQIYCIKVLTLTAVGH